MQWTAKGITLQPSFLMEGGRWKVEGGRWKVEGGRRKVEGERKKVEGGKWSYVSSIEEKDDKRDTGTRE